MRLRHRTVIAAGSVGAVALAMTVAVLAGPRSQWALLAVSGIAAVAMCVPSLFAEPRDLLAVLFFGVPPVMSLAAEGSPTWLIGPLAALLLVGGELNAFCWESGGPPALRSEGRRRSAGIATLALVGLVGSLAVAAAARWEWLDEAAAVAVAAGAIAGLARVVLPASALPGRTSPP